MTAVRVLLPVLLLLLGACLAGYVGYLKSELKDATDRAAAAEAQVEAHERAAAALTEHLTRVEAERAAWETIATELEKEEGVENTLSPYLRGVLNSVR